MWKRVFAREELEGPQSWTQLWELRLYLNPGVRRILFVVICFSHTFNNNFVTVIVCCVRPCLHGGRITLCKGYPSRRVTLAYCLSAFRLHQVWRWPEQLARVPLSVGISRLCSQNHENLLFYLQTCPFMHLTYILLKSCCQNQKVAWGCWKRKKLLKSPKVAQKLPSTIGKCLPVNRAIFLSV